MHQLRSEQIMHTFALEIWSDISFGLRRIMIRGGNYAVGEHYFWESHSE